MLMGKFAERTLGRHAIFRLGRKAWCGAAEHNTRGCASGEYAPQTYRNQEP